MGRHYEYHDAIKPDILLSSVIANTAILVEERSQETARIFRCACQALAIPPLSARFLTANCSNRAELASSTRVASEGRRIWG